MYSRRRPRNTATNATLEPTASGGSVRHSTDRMFAYHAVALPTSAAKRATSSRERAISMRVTTSTPMPATLHDPARRLAVRRVTVIARLAAAPADDA